VDKLKEALYKLGDPDKAQHHWPITSHFIIVPLYESKAWPHNKIVTMAKLHMATINKLSPLYIKNLEDINKHLTLSDGLTLTIHQGFNQVKTQQANPSIT